MSKVEKGRVAKTIFTSHMKYSKFSDKKQAHANSTTDTHDY